MGSSSLSEEGYQVKALAEPCGQRRSSDRSPPLSICLLWFYLARVLRTMKGKLPEASEVRPH